MKREMEHLHGSRSRTDCLVVAGVVLVTVVSLVSRLPND